MRCIAGVLSAWKHLISLLKNAEGMNTRIILRVSTLVLLIHGIIELLSVLSIFTGEAPSFIFKELRENWQQTVLISIVSGFVRIVAAAGVSKGFKWGLMLGIVFSAATYSGLAFYLPYGMMDALLSGLALVLLTMAYWNKEKIDV